MKVPKIKLSQEEEEEEKKSNEEFNQIEDLYASQITSLQDLGFTDLPEIISALKNSDGQLEQAIDYLFSKQTREVIHISPPSNPKKTIYEIQAEENEKLSMEMEQLMIQRERERLEMEQDLYERR